MKERTGIRQMFSNISERYDLLNHLLSLNMDRRWRKRLSTELTGVMGLILDIGTGTGDVALEIARKGKSVLCFDFSHEMLLLGKRKIRMRRLENSLRIIEADSLALPLRDSCADAICTAFTIRNLEEMEAGFLEMARVLKPNGRILILEFSNPTNMFMKALYYPYLRFFMPAAGALIGRDGNAYRYLTATILSFPEQQKIAERLKRAGFERVTYEKLTGGIVTLYRAFRQTS